MWEGLLEWAYSEKIKKLKLKHQKSTYTISCATTPSRKKRFAEALEEHDAVEVYAKLPKRFYIDTPMGHYNPDWTIAFKDDAGVKHIYFVAETKGEGVDESNLRVSLRGVEQAKIECARKHFAKISNGDCIYGVCDSYEKLLKLVDA